MGYFHFLRKKPSIFTGFLITYLIILLIPLFSGILFYSQILQMIEDDAKQSTLYNLEHSKDILDERFAEIDRYITQLVLDRRIRQFNMATQPLEAYDLYTVWEILRNMSVYRSTSKFFTTFYIYFKNSDSIISPHAFYRAPSFYGPYFAYSDLEEEAWYEKIFSRLSWDTVLPAANVTIKGKTNKMITRVRSIPLESPRNPKGFIWVMIEEEQILKNLHQESISNGGWAYITDRDGSIITALSYNNVKIDPIEIDPAQAEGFLHLSINNQRMLVCYTTSEFNGWRYIAAVPYKAVTAKVAYVKRIAIIVNLSVLLLGIMAAYLFSYTKTKPIKSFIKTISNIKGQENIKGADEYDILGNSLRMIIERNKGLRNTIEAQTPLLRAMFFERLIRGEYKTTEEIQAIRSQFRIDITGEKFVILLLKINGYAGLITEEALHELNMIRAVIKNELSNTFGKNIISHDIDEKMIVVLLGFEKIRSDGFKKEMESLCRELHDVLLKNGIKVSIAAGNIYGSLQRIWHSFIESHQTMDNMLTDSMSPIVWYSQMKKGSDQYFYPLEIESRLINVVKAGDSDELAKLLSIIYDENTVNRELSAEVLRELFFEMKGTVAKLIGQLKNGMNEPQKDTMLTIGKLVQEGTADEIFHGLKEIFESICSEINNQKNSHNRRLIDNITEYIHSHYTEWDICRYKVASQFGLTEVYLSQFFKEQTGQYFSDYLEMIRIKHCCEQLPKDNSTIKEIAEGAGYSNDQVFRRAFKRVVGVSPSNYKNAEN